MKCVPIIVVVLAVTSGNFALAATTIEPQGQQQQIPAASSLNTLFDDLPEETLLDTPENYRAKRATCDLFSGFGVSSSLCAAHCIAKRFRGGYCNAKRVCVCRR